MFALLGTLACLSDLLMEGLPNIHLLGTLFTLCTLVYRAKALLPIYVYVLLIGLSSGIGVWWLPYLYIWLPLWGGVMLLPRRLPMGVRLALAHAVSVLHGLAFGTLYAPAQAILFHLTPSGTLAWIAAGFSFDLLHALGNLALGFLIYPLYPLLLRLSRGK